MDDIQATAEWPETEYECSSNINSNALLHRIEHFLTIGPFCGSSIFGGEFKFSERTAECSNGNDWNIDVLTEEKKFYCMERETYFLRDDEWDISIPEVRVFANDFMDDCYSFVGDP